jgi:archaellum component FlaG (FlaF/FlaG flagellin family)
MQNMTSMMSQKRKTTADMILKNMEVINNDKKASCCL